MKCDKCKVNEAVVIFETIGNYCLDCYNGIIADAFGLNLYTDYSRNITVIDSSGHYHHFKISNHFMPSCSEWIARQVDGYEFRVMIGTDEDQASGVRKLHAKIFKALTYKSLNERSLDQKTEGTYNIGDKEYSLKPIGTGTIACNPELEDAEKYGILIDGKHIPFKDFGRMSSCHEGFTFEYQFRDTTESLLQKDMALKKVDISKKAVLFRFDRYFRWLLEGNRLPPENEIEFIKAMEECIDDLQLMLVGDLVEDCIEVAEYMKTKLSEVRAQSESLIDLLLQDIDRTTWYLKDFPNL